MLVEISCLFMVLANVMFSVYGQPKIYGVLLIPGFDELDVFGPLEYINALPNATVHLIAESSLEPVWSATLNSSMVGIHKIGQYVLSTHTIATAPPLDVLILVGGGGSRAILGGLLKPSIAFIAERYPSLQYLLSICTGNALTAASGILNGRSATGNKRSWSFVTGQGPLVNWVPKARWVVDSNIWTSSGVEAGTDMIYSFIREVYSEHTADTLASMFEHYPHTDPSFDPFADLYNTTGTLIPPPATPAALPAHPTTYGIIAYPGVGSLELWGTLEFLRSTNIAIPTNVSVVAATLSPITTNVLNSGTTPSVALGLPKRGQTLLPDFTFETAPAFEVLIVIGAPRVPNNPQIASFIASRYASTRYLISTGTGSALIAQSGVLAHARAATSKYFFNQVAHSYPSVQWVPKTRWVVSNGGKIWSAAGGAATLDMMAGFLSETYGPAFAQNVCANLEYVPSILVAS